MPVIRIDGSRANFDQNLVVIRNRLFDLLKLKDPGWAVVVIDNGFYLCRSGWARCLAFAGAGSEGMPKQNVVMRSCRFVFIVKIGFVRLAAQPALLFL